MNTFAKSGLTLAVLAWPSLASAQVFDLGEIVVLPLATPTEEDRTGATVEVLDQEALDEGGESVLAERLVRLPGVNLSRTGGPGTQSTFVIRGASTEYVSVYIDGILVTDPSAPKVGYSEIGGFVTGTTNRVEILKGSQSALFGGSAVGGVVSIPTLGEFELGDGTFQRAAIEAGSFGTYGGAYSITRNTGDLSLSFGVSYVTSDGFSAADENDGNTEADGYDRTRYAAQVIYRASDTLTFGANAFIEDGRTEFDEFTVTDGATPGDDVSFRDAFGARAFVTYDNGAYTNETTLSFYGIDRESVGTNGFGDSSFSARGERYQVTNVTSFSASETVDLSIGLDYLNERSIAGGLPTAGETTSTTGGFVEGVYSPTDQTDIIATLRLDSHSAFGEFLTGRLAFAYRPDGQTTYRGALATGYRAPSISELFADFGSFTGNPDLVPETSVTAELGVDRDLAGGGQVSATVFWGQIDDLIQTTSDFSTVENVSGASLRQGIELSGSMPLKGGATIYGAATFIEARTADGTPLARVPSTDIVIGGTLDVSDRVTLNGNARYVAGLYDAGAYLPSFTVVNAGAEYTLSETASAYLRVENLLGTEYQTVTGYGTSDFAVFAGLRANF